MFIYFFAFLLMASRSSARQEWVNEAVRDDILNNVWGIITVSNSDETSEIIFTH